MSKKHKVTKLEFETRCSSLQRQIHILQNHLGLTDITNTTKQLDQSIFNGLDEMWKFAAVDANGDAYFFGECPEKDLELQQWDIHYTKECSSIDGVFDSTDWENSLIKRKEKALSGNDICSHLLSTNSKLVMCLVSDISEHHAIQNECLTIINGKETQKFTSISPLTWKYVVPVNNMGEHLTAKDVGL